MHNLDQIKVYFQDNIVRQVPAGISLYELSLDVKDKYKSDIVAAKVNNDIKELTWRLEEDCRVEFIDLTFDDGMRIYRRGLVYLLVKAVKDLFPDTKVMVNHSVGNGFYCEITGIGEMGQFDETGKRVDLDEQTVARIDKQMHELVAQKIPFIKKILPIEEARELFHKKGQEDKFRIFEYRKKPYVTVYSCGNLVDYFYGYMPPDTGYLKTFELKSYGNGLILRFPHKNSPYKLDNYTEYKKLFNVFSEHKKWVRILEIDDVAALNDCISGGRSGELIRISEALHEKKLAQLADMITSGENKKRAVLISGPSSSGKTTFASRLSIQLRVNGLKPVMISLDNYFVNREDTPKDEKGEYDYEALEALDLKLFNEQLATLVHGGEVEIPIFNFKTGTREKAGNRLRLNDDQLLVIEGIHGLNEKLTASVDKKTKFKIYISPLTTINIDDHNRIPSTDLRILRRMVRDFQFRNASPVKTIQYWPSVRRGEERNIFPFQEQADAMFNSSLPYELSVIKALAESHLEIIDRSFPEYAEARRLLEFLSYFLPLGSADIPQNSIMKEFIGGSCFA